MRCLLFAALAALLVMPLFSSNAEAAAARKILVVGSSEREMELADGSQMAVGFFLNEFAVPAEYLAGKGYEIVLATPSGKAPVMDAASNDKKFFGGSEAAREEAENFVRMFRRALEPVIARDDRDVLPQLARILNSSKTLSFCIHGSLWSFQLTAPEGK